MTKPSQICPLLTPNTNQSRSLFHRSQRLSVRPASDTKVNQTGSL